VPETVCVLYHEMCYFNVKMDQNGKTSLAVWLHPDTLRELTALRTCRWRKVRKWKVTGREGREKRKRKVEKVESDYQQLTSIVN